MRKLMIILSMYVLVTKANAMFLTGLLIGGVTGYLIHDAKDRNDTTIIYEHSKEDECSKRIYHYNNDKTVKSIECIK